MHRGPPHLGPLVVLLLVVPGCLVEPGPSADSLEDATGTHVDVSDLSRIVPTSHDLVEILYEMGHAKRIVAVPNWIDHPVDSKALTRCKDARPDPGDPCSMGRPHVLGAEEILAVGPSLVLLKDHPLQPTNLAVQLRGAGVPVFVFDNDETLDNVKETYHTLGRILERVDPGAPANATARIDAFDAAHDALVATVKTSDTPRPLALYQLPSAFVAGRGTSADLLLELAGAKNLARETGLRGYQQISREVLLDRDPERVVASFTAASHPDVFFDNPRYEQTTAARLGPETLRIVDPAVTALVGPRFIDGAAAVAAWLHPVAFGHFEAEAAIEQDGRTITVTAEAWNATAGPITYRFDPGDGTAPVDQDHGTFSHTYDAAATPLVRLLIIDGAGRIHEQRWTPEVTP